ncbi:MAG: 5-oxoprolinase subunit PxpB [Clostridia bacterium]|nr:5-oxoprolinase subunit PxpB [Clostridia bacterium]
MIRPCGDQALMVMFEQRISEEIHQRVIRLDVLLRNDPAVWEIVPAYASVLVYYDPLAYTYAEMEKRIRKHLSGDVSVREADGKCVVIPVCYGGEHGPDLAFVAANAGLSESEVIQLHSGREYRIYMLGFLPGFPYLGGMDPRLETPRLPSPRTLIPAGSVGIGGQQTGIYPFPSPGGWRLIGRTPVSLFRSSGPEEKVPIFQAGDRIRFEPISPEEYQSMMRERDGC